MADKIADLHPAEVSLEAAEVMQVLPDRRSSQPTVHGQEFEEPRHRLNKRVVLMRATSTLEARNHDPQHLLDPPAHFFGHLLRCTAVLAVAPMATNALGHIRVDMSWQVSDFSRSPQATARGTRRQIERTSYPSSAIQPTYRSTSEPIHDALMRSTVSGLAKYVSSMTPSFLPVDEGSSLPSGRLRYVPGISRAFWIPASGLGSRLAPAT
jgi:hypothetical protein